MQPLGTVPVEMDCAAVGAIKASYFQYLVSRSSVFIHRYMYYSSVTTHYRPGARPREQAAPPPELQRRLRGPEERERRAGAPLPPRRTAKSKLSSRAPKGAPEVIKNTLFSTCRAPISDPLLKPRLHEPRNHVSSIQKHSQGHRRAQNMS